MRVIKGMKGHLATRCARLGAVSVLVLAAVLRGVCAASQDAPSSRPSPGTPHEVVFAQYSPLFSNAEIVRRLLSPLAREALLDKLGRDRTALSSYPIDLAKERFLIYVPSSAPPSPHGFGLIVFVSPWDRPDLPLPWTSQLDRYGLIFVSPARAGNAAAVLNRRAPLALAAEENIVRDYPIDRTRVYVGGFSGGSRVALRIALGYPDVFRGALLNAGADPLGGGDPLPPRDLFALFQSSTRLVYVSGTLDTVNLEMDASSSQSMRQWCVANVENHDTLGADHEEMQDQALGWALERLMQPVPLDSARMSACRAHVEAGLQEKLSHAQALISKGSRRSARGLLLDIDRHFGGLAAPRILELAKRCDCGLAPPGT